LQLLSASQPSCDGELTTPEVAQHLGRSLAWVKRHARELGGHIVDGAYQFPTLAIERRRTTTERITLGGPPAKETDVGPRAAAIYRRLEEGQSTSQIVRELEEAPEFVAKTRAQWLAGYRADREGLEFRCGACGAPSDPQFARCRSCAGRTRTLTDAQIAQLAKESAAPPASVEDIEQQWRDRVAVVVDGGAVRVLLMAEAGAQILKTLSDEETCLLGTQLAGLGLAAERG
jgi:hypothetical protein